MRHQHRALACGERCPIALHDADLALQRRHRPLTAPGAIQRARHRHRTSGGEVGLGTATGPAMHLAVDEHERQVYIVAGERLFGDRTLGLGEQGVELAFEVLELTRATIRTAGSSRWGRSLSAVQTSRGVGLSTGVWDTSIGAALHSVLVSQSALLQRITAPSSLRRLPAVTNCHRCSFIHILVF